MPETVRQLALASIQRHKLTFLSCPYHPAFLDTIFTAAFLESIYNNVKIEAYLCSFTKGFHQIVISEWRNGPIPDENPGLNVFQAFIFQFLHLRKEGRHVNHASTDSKSTSIVHGVVEEPTDEPIRFMAFGLTRPEG